MTGCNILLVSHDFSVTGAPNSLLRQAKYFKEAGHNVEVWSLGGGNLLDRYVEAGFNPLFVENSRKGIKDFYEKRKQRFDFIICNTIITYKAVDVLQRYDTPLVWFVRETKLLDDFIKKSSDFATVFKNFYNIYTVSEYAANVCRQYNPEIKIINNAIADDFSGLNASSNSIRFGYIGSVMEVKGVDVLIEAYKAIWGKHKNISLSIAGSFGAPYGKKLVKRTSKIESIKWLGEIQKDHKKEFFENIDVLCVPSLDEPSGLVVLEGAMHGKALIVTDKVGAAYMVAPQNGYVVKANDSKALSQAMENIIKKADGLKSMKQSSRKRYLKYGTIDREQKDVLHMLKENIGRKPIVKNDLVFEDELPISKEKTKKRFGIGMSSDGRHLIVNLGIIKIKFRLRKQKDKALPIDVYLFDEHSCTKINSYKKLPKNITIRASCSSSSLSGWGNALKIHKNFKSRGVEITYADRCIKNMCTLDDSGDSPGVAANIIFLPGEENELRIGKQAEINGTKIWLGNGSKCYIGDDCLFSYETVIRTTDGHTILNKENGSIINEQKNACIIGDNCWLGMRCFINKNVQLAHDTIVGSCSVVTSKFNEPYNIIAGNPAKIIKSNVKHNRKTIYDYKNGLL